MARSLQGCNCEGRVVVLNACRVGAITTLHDDDDDDDHDNDMAVT